MTMFHPPASATIVTLRQLQAGEEWFLKEMLYHALFTPANQQPFPAAIVDLPELSRYVTGFGRPGDVGWVAEHHGKLIGASWSRLFSAAQPGYGFVDEQTPELSMAIKPAYRGQGIGTRLLTAVIDTLFQRGHQQLSLSVDTRNRAVHFYERVGFEAVTGAETTQIMVKVQTT